MEKLKNNSKIKLDRYYNPIINKEEIYKDVFVEDMGEILELKEKGKISEGVANFLSGMVIKKEIKKEIEKVVEWRRFGVNQKDTLLLGVTTKQNYV